MRVAITGSTGLVGRALAQRLTDRGDEVTRIVRGARGADGVDWAPADEGWVRDGAFDGCEAVVHLGGASIGEGRWTAKRKAELRSSRIESTQVLVAHLASLEARPRRLVVASAVGYYGDRGDEQLSEASAKGAGFLADLVADWEGAAEKANAAGIPAAMVRSGVVFAKDASAFRRLVLPFRFGVGGRLGNGRQWMPWVTLEDLVSAIEHLLAGELTGPVNVVAPGAITNRELTKALGRVLRRPTLMMVPRFAMQLAMGGAAGELLFASQRVVPERLMAEGFEFAHPEVEGALHALLRGD